jgi:hypothetical protein
MKTPFTEASTFFVSVEGKTMPVVSSDTARVMEIRMDAALKSQSSAWNIISAANWKSQTDDWRTLARHWQNHTYVQPELPLPFPPHIPRNLARVPRTIQEACAQISMLEHSLRLAESQLRIAEQFENEMVAKIIHLENTLNDIKIPNRPSGTN